jgi:hypothetical protein
MIEWTWQNTVSTALYISVIAGFVCYPRMKPVYLRAFVWWLFLYAIGDLTLYLFFKKVPNGLLVPIVYCSLEPFGVWIYAYVLLFGSQPHFKLRSISWSVIFIIFLIFAAYQLIFQLENQESANASFLIKSILTLGIVLFYFWELIRSDRIVVLSREPIFWIATPSLFYFAGNIIATGFYHQIYAYSKELAGVLYRLNYILETVLYLLCILAFVLSARRK